MLQGVGPSVALGRDTTMLREILDKTGERLDKELKGQPEVEAELRDTIGVVYRDLGVYEKAEAMHRKAVEIEKELFGKEHPVVSRSLDNLAMVLVAEGKLAAAETTLREALAMQKKLLGNKNPYVALSLNRLAIVLDQQGKWIEAETMFREALAMKIEFVGNEHPDIAAALRQFGHCAPRSGQAG